MMLENKVEQEGITDSEIAIGEKKESSKDNLLENQGKLRKVTFEFDSNTGATLVNLETLKNINIELGHVAEDVRNTDLSNASEMALMFYGIDHKIMMIADLFHYTVKELEKNIESTEVISGIYFDLIVRANDQVKEQRGLTSI